MTFIGLAALVVFAMVRGLLIPKSSHERELQVMREAHAVVVKGLEARVVEKTDEKNEWQATAKLAEQVSSELLSQNRELLEVNKTTAYALDEIRTGLVAQTRDVTP